MQALTKRLLLLASVLVLLAMPLAANAQAPIVAIGGNDELGPFLVAGSNQMTLYTFANDEPGVSNCEGACLENWPAFTVGSAAEVANATDIPGTLGTITRSDGSLQVTFNDQPLYFFSADQQPGDATGQGAGDVWFVVSVAVAETTQPAEQVEPDADAAQTDDAATDALAAAAELPANDLVSLTETSLGRVLAGANGMTLYTFANDEPGVSNCVDRCLELWPPLTVASAEALPVADEGLLARLSVIERPDGALQVALDDAPLYFYTEDAQPGDVNGQGVGSVWFAVTVDVVRAGGNDDLGSFLVAGSNGMTLYTFANDEPGVSNCVDQCVEIWPPLLVESSQTLLQPDNLNGELSVIERPDGSQQLALNDQPLYFYSEDEQPGDANGQGVGSVWFVVPLDTVRIQQNAEFGNILVGADGMTLYTFANDEPGWSNCVGDCANVWPPLTVDSPDAIFAPAEIRESLTATGRADGTFQVNLNDQPLYFFTGDEAPGETNGHGRGGVWSVATLDGVQLSLGACNVTPLFAQVNLRTGPGTDFAPAGVAGTGTALIASGQATGTDGFVWFLLNDNTWVRSDVVDSGTECASLATVAAPAAPVVATSSGY